MNEMMQQQPNAAYYAEAVLQLLPIPVVHINSALEIQYYNPCFQKLCLDYLEFLPDHLLGCRIQELMPAMRMETIAKIQTMVDEQIPFVETGVRFEYPFEWTSKPTYWDLNLIPFPSEQPVAKGMLILARDVTRRINTDLALQQSEERIRRITNNLDIIVYRIGFRPEIHLDYINTMIEKISGYDREAFYQRPELITRIIHPDDRPLVDEYTAKIYHESDTVCVRWIRKDGQLIWTEHQMIKIC